MNIVSINTFNKLPDDANILAPAGIYLKVSGMFVHYPEYQGVKSGWYNYYKKLADINGWHPSLLNDILHQQINNIIVVNY